MAEFSNYGGPRHGSSSSFFAARSESILIKGLLQYSVADGKGTSVDVIFF